MKLLQPDQYHKVVIPLKQMTINNLFARSVVEKHVKGAVYVNDEEKPETFYVVHPYHMSLLFGKTDNDDFNKSFRDHAFNTFKVRDTHEWMQAFPGDWHPVLASLFKGRLMKAEDRAGDSHIEMNTRVNFKFNPELYLAARPGALNDPAFKIVRCSKSIYRKMKGSVVPMYFWDSAEDFYNKGIGFSLLHDDELVATAYSSFIHEQKLEIGIETVNAYRGKGFAGHVCGALIDYCLENNYEPVWSCRLENTASYKLALKLGFEETIRIPYYRLNN